ncbi:hypothetical protein HanPI659440_Chr05g0205591 [Helianthus annuus]|nr:hypothetical protein HanPI659440_Chr05g0205591 [Helianthus annuus]
MLAFVMGVESLVKDREVGWRKERETLLAHQEKLKDDLKYFQTVASDASKDVEDLPIEMTMV